MQCPAELEKGPSADNSTSSSAATTQRKAERPRANSSGSIDQNRLTGGPAGGGLASGGKLMLQIPIGPQCKPRRGHSPGNMRREWVPLNVAAWQLTCWFVCLCEKWIFNVFLCLFFSTCRYQDHSSSEDILVKVDKVCLVFFFVFF